MINIQARKVTDNLISLIKQIDPLVDSADKRGEDTKFAFVVLLTDQPDAAAPKLEEVAKKHDIKNVPLTVFEGSSGPESYKIAKEAEVTVMMWEDLKVKVNHAFGADELNDEAVKKVVADAKKFLASDSEE